MIKNITQFKAVINNIESLFHFESNCPTAVAKEALIECLKWIGQIEDNAKQMAQEQEIVAEEEHPKVEEINQPEEEATAQ